MNKIIFGLRYVYFRLFYGFYHLGWPVGFGAGVSIRNARYISLGNNVFLDNNVVLQLSEEHMKYGLQKPKVEIEDKVTIGLGTMISAAEHILIKKNVLISQHCFIGDHDHEYRRLVPSANVAITCTVVSHPVSVVRVGIPLNSCVNVSAFGVVCPGSKYARRNTNSRPWPSTVAVTTPPFCSASIPTGVASPKSISRGATDPASSNPINIVATNIAFMFHS